MSEATPGCHSFHVWEYIDEERIARGWTKETLAQKMGGDIEQNLCILDFCMLRDERSHLGKSVAKKLATAFDGTSCETWLRLDRAWRLATGNPK